MAMPVFIDGIWRNLWASHVRVNGVWRDMEVSTVVDGVNREVYRSQLTAEDIIGFRIVYHLRKDLTHPDFPNLVYNPNIPVLIDTAGTNEIQMTTNAKSFIFQFSNENPYEEGIVGYTGRLYAAVKGGILIDIGNSSGRTMMEDIQFDPKIPGVESAWISNRLKEVDIAVYGEILHESYGYFTAGWNHFLNDTPTIDPTNYPDKVPKQTVRVLDNYQVTKSMYRQEGYKGTIAIGIARDMNSPDNNMVGAHGTLDHTIEKIFVNGESYPFSLEIYDEY